MNLFFTADTHFHHKNIIQYCNRPFKDVEEMNEMMIQRWNEVVGVEDTVIHVGDFGIGNIRKLQDIRVRLNGMIWMVLGNHDWNIKPHRWIEDLGMINADPFIDVQGMHVRHHPMNSDERLYNNIPEDKWILCGHVHDHWIFNGRKLNVGLDVHNFTNINIDKIKEQIRQMELTYQIMEKDKNVLKELANG